MVSVRMEAWITCGVIVGKRNGDEDGGLGFGFGFGLWILGVRVDDVDFGERKRCSWGKNEYRI